MALAQERTLRRSSQGVKLCFSAFRHAIDVLGCRMPWWTPTGALPIECIEATPSAYFHSVSANVSCSCRNFCLYFFVVDLSNWQTKKNKTIRSSCIVPIFTLHVPPERARTCRDGSSAKCWQCVDGQGNVERNILYHWMVTGASFGTWNTSKIFTCCVDRHANSW